MSDSAVCFERRAGGRRELSSVLTYCIGSTPRHTRGEGEEEADCAGLVLSQRPFVDDRSLDGIQSQGAEQPTQGGSPEGGGHCQLEQLQDVSAFGIITLSWKH